MSDSGSGSQAPEDRNSIPESVLEEVERLTRLARRTSSPDEQAVYRERRENLLADYDYTARVRSDEHGETLVCYPAEWDVDGTVDPARVDDVDRGIEISLSGTGDPDEWADVHEENQAVADAVRDAEGETHGDNADALADFASNHYAKPIADLTPAELTEFREDYYRRNVWADPDVEAVLDESIAAVYRTLDVPHPLQDGES